MNQYLVSWDIDIFAESPEAAAAQALAIQRDPNSTATFFTVRAEATGEEKHIDIEPEH